MRRVCFKQVCVWVGGVVRGQQGSLEGITPPPPSNHHQQHLGPKGIRHVEEGRGWIIEPLPLCLSYKKG